MNVVNTAAPKWAVRVRPAGEVLAATSQGADLSLALLGIPVGFTPVEVEGWLADLRGVATETSRADTRRRAIPALLHHSLTGLLFSQSELWGRAADPAPCTLAFANPDEGPAFGWVGEARVAIELDGRPLDPQWVRVRDDEGREARAITFGPGHRVSLRIEWPSPAGGRATVAAVEATWAPAAAVTAPSVPMLDVSSVAAMPDAAPVEREFAMPQLGQRIEAPPEVFDAPPPDELDAALYQHTLPTEQPGLAAPLAERAQDPHAVPAHAPRADLAHEAHASFAPPARGDFHAEPHRSGGAADDEPAERPAHPVQRWLSKLVPWRKKRDADEDAAPAFAPRGAATPARVPVLPSAPEPEPDRLSGAPAVEQAAFDLAAEIGRAGVPTWKRDPDAREFENVEEIPADVSALPTISPPVPAGRPANIDVTHEPVGADTGFAIPQLPTWLRTAGSEPKPAAEIRSLHPGHHPGGPAPAPPSFAPPVPAGPPQVFAPPPAPRAAPAAPPVLPSAARTAPPRPTTPAPPVHAPAPPINLPSPTGTESRPHRLEAPPHVAPQPQQPQWPAPPDHPSGGARAAPPPAHAAPPQAAPTPPPAPVDFVADDDPFVQPNLGRPRQPGAPRIRPEWPAAEELESSRASLVRRYWPWAAGAAVLLAFGWILGGAGSHQRSPLSRAAGAFGLARPTYDVVVNSRPAGAWIAVDGKDVARRTPSTVSISPGEHEITLTLPELGSATVPVRGVKGDRVTLDPSLAGSLEVYSSNASVPIAVRLDGKPIGYAPVQLDDVAPGLHELTFTGPNMPAWAQNVQVGVRQTAQVIARPMTSPSTGVIQVQATLADEGGSAALSGAQVYVDGELRGTTPVSVEVPRGPHSLRVVWRGTTAPIQVIDLPGGNQRFASFSFGLDDNAPRLALVSPPRTIAAGQTSVVSAAIDGLSSGEIREGWLHVRSAEGLWRRYEMTSLKGPDGVVLVSVFPGNAFDSDGRTKWYVSAVTLQGDEYFSDMQTTSRPPRPQPAAPAETTP